MLKNMIAIVVGYIVWTVIFLGGTSAVRGFRPDVHDENEITSDTSTLVIYLVISIVASLAAGLIAAKIGGTCRTLCAAILAVCLLATGIPVQLSAGSALPVWYNLLFLVLLVPVTLAGAMLIRKPAD